MRLPKPALPIGFGVIALVAVLGVTRAPGPGLDPDAASYLGAAESFASHGTLRIPFGSWDSPDGTEALAHFPPGFPLVLAGPAALGADPVQAARGVEAAAAALAAGGSVWLVMSVSGPLAWALGGALLLLTPGLALDHLRVLSEPLFLALAVLTLLLMVRAPDRALAHGLVAGLATSVRYAGVGLAGGAVVWALARPRTARRRLLSACLAGAPALLFQVAWTLRARAQFATVRSFGLKSGIGATLLEGWTTLAAWLAPGVTRPILGGAIALLVLGLAGATVVTAARREPTFLGAVGLLAACYAALVLVSRLFADAWIPLDERLLSPLFLFASLGVAAAVAAGWRDARPGVRRAGGLVLVAWLAASGWRTGVTVREARDGGWGYASTDWRSSDLVRRLGAEAARSPIFSDDPAGVWFATGRRSWKLPDTAEPDSVAAFGALLRARRGVMVGFARPLEPMARPADIAERLALPVLARFEDAVVWGPPAP